MQNRNMTKLIREAKGHDADAFTSLMQFYMKDMYRVAIAILMNDEDAADAIQETILACWEKMYMLKKERFFRTWMTRILINKCYDIRKYHEKITDLEEFEETAVRDAYNVELKEALQTLDDKYRLVITLFYIDGYRTGEIAKMLKIPKSTVQTRLKRARERLAAYYNTREE